MFFRLFSYFKFLLKSTNQHGVHSPFVYDFVTKGLYKKETSNINLNVFKTDKKLSKKEEKILLKVVQYFNLNLQSNNLDLNNTKTKFNFNLLFYNYLNYKNIVTLNSKNPNSFIIINNIYNDKKSQENWKKIIALPKATVTIDLFYFGIIFFRKEQEKEHFVIRV